MLNLYFQKMEKKINSTKVILHISSWMKPPTMTTFLISVFCVWVQKLCTHHIVKSKAKHTTQPHNCLQSILLGVIRNNLQRRCLDNTFSVFYMYNFAFWSAGCGRFFQKCIVRVIRYSVHGAIVRLNICAECNVRLRASQFVVCSHDNVARSRMDAQFW